MKKIMLSSLVLLPLIVLLILTLGGMVVSKTSYIYVEKVEFTESDVLVLIKDGQDDPTAQLTVNVLPLRATDKSVVFSSDDESIVTVSADGVVTGVDYGTTFVRVASASDGTKSAMRRVLVTDDAVHRIEISGAPELLYVGQSAQLSAAVYPQEAENVSVNWTSDNDGVLSVSKEGRLTPRSKGAAVITASSAADPSVSASVTVQVKIPVTDIWVDDGSAVTIAGSTAQFPAVHFNEGAEERITYTSSDDRIATVDENGKIQFYKAGTVIVTATVTEGTERPVSVSKSYTSTQGAYTSIGFNVSRLEADYDEWQGKALELFVVGSPEGADAAYDITFSEEGVLSYDAESGAFTVVGTSKNGVVVTVESRTADGELISGKATVVVTRKATELAFTQEEISLSSARADLSEYLIVTEMYTDTISYSASDPSIATIEGNDVVFRKEGTVTVTVRSAEGGAQAEARVTYISGVTAEDEEIVVNEDYTGGESVVLDYYGEEKYDSGILIIQPPEGYTLSSVESDDPSVAEIGGDGTKIIPERGGYAHVTVTASNAAGARWVKEIDVFVHRAADEVSFAPETELDREGNGFVTAKGQVQFTEPVIAPDDARFEKTFVWSVDVGSDVAEITQDGLLTFKKAGAVQVKVGVYYGETQETYRTVTVRSTFGQAEAFDLFRGDEKFDGQPFVLSDIGESISFTVKNIFPSDAPADIAVSPQGSASFSVQTDGSAVSFTALGVQNGERFTVSVGNASMTVTLSARALAQNISVTGWNIGLRNGIDYKTFEGTAVLTAGLSRSDGVTPSDMKIQWSTDGTHWQEGTAGAAFSVSLSDGANRIYVKSADGSAGAYDEFSIEKILAYADFGLKAEYSDGTGGAPVLAGEVVSVRQTGAMTLTVPYQVARFTLTVLAPEEEGTVYVGCVPESAFARGDCSAWAKSVVYDPELAAFSFEFSGGAFTGSFTLAAAAQSDLVCTVNVVHSGLSRISLTGFDMGNKGDVFGNGYQQVRLFGKKSYYNNGTVSYLKIPLVLEGASESGSLADLLTWTFTPYAGNDIDGNSPACVQTGRKVTYDGATYTVSLSESGAASLVCEDGSAAPSSVIWADAYSEAGYVRIYFGDFNGLSEADVRGDNFGNFDYLEGESANDDGNGYGLDGKAAPGTGRYLSMVVSDGTDKVKDGFNFNVVNDGVNVFDAAGYIANSSVVLHHSLYSPEDQAAAGGDDYVLSSVTKSHYAKTLVYGNGYQVDMGAYNSGDEVQNASSDHVTVNIGRAYNLTLKGTPAKVADGDAGIDEDVRDTYGIELTGTYYAYVDFQALYRILVDDGVTTYIDHCIFRYMNDCSVSLVWSGGPNAKGGGTAYISNVVGIDSGDNAFEWTYGRYYFSGFVDVFNYKNASQIVRILNLGGLEILFKSTVKGWFNGEYKAYSSYASYDSKDPYANIIGFSKTEPSEANGVLFGSSSEAVWSNPKNGVVSDAATGLNVLFKSYLGMDISFLTTKAESGLTSFKCQYQENGKSLVFNAEHLAWHAARVYRDTAMVGWNIEDHVAGENTL